MLSSYPKVLAFGHRLIGDILEGDYHLEEKVDGSQMSFGIKSGELHLRSKGAQLYVDNPEKMFSLGIRYVESISDRLVDRYTYRCEYLRSPKHNTIAYNSIPKNHLVLFDVEDENGNPLPHDTKSDMAEEMEIDCVPLISADIGSTDDLKSILDRDSYLGGAKIEGIVIKNYNKFTLDGKYAVGKYVSEAFKERHTREWKAANPSNRDVIDMIIDSLKTEARYMKAVQHLTEAGLCTDSPKDIGNLLKELHKDIDAEEEEFIKDKLFEHYIKNIKRGVCNGFPEWYKMHLASKLLD